MKSSHTKSFHSSGSSGNNNNNNSTSNSSTSINSNNNNHNNDPNQCTTSDRIEFILPSTSGCSKIHKSNIETDVRNNNNANSLTMSLSLKTTATTKCTGALVTAANANSNHSLQQQQQQQQPTTILLPLHSHVIVDNNNKQQLVVDCDGDGDQFNLHPLLRDNVLASMSENNFIILNSTNAGGSSSAITTTNINNNSGHLNEHTNVINVQDLIKSVAVTTGTGGDYGGQLILYGTAAGPGNVDEGKITTTTKEELTITRLQMKPVQAGLQFPQMDLQKNEDSFKFVMDEVEGEGGVALVGDVSVSVTKSLSGDCELLEGDVDKTLTTADADLLLHGGDFGQESANAEDTEAGPGGVVNQSGNSAITTTSSSTSSSSSSSSSTTGSGLPGMGGSNNSNSMLPNSANSTSGTGIGGLMGNATGGGLVGGIGGLGTPSGGSVLGGSNLGNLMIVNSVKNSHINTNTTASTSTLMNPLVTTITPPSSLQPQHQPPQPISISTTTMSSITAAMSTSPTSITSSSSSSSSTSSNSSSAGNLAGNSSTHHVQPPQQQQRSAADLKDVIEELCPVCGDKVSGYHYGLLTCESCKGFFKRTVQNKKVYTCVAERSCHIDKTQRKRCPYCRFQKCLDVGMKLEAVRADRMRGGRNKFGPMYKRDRARKLQILRQRQLALQAIRGQINGPNVTSNGNLLDGSQSQLSPGGYQPQQAQQQQSHPQQSQQSYNMLIKQEIQIPQVSSLTSSPDSSPSPIAIALGQVNNAGGGNTSMPIGGGGMNGPNNNNNGNGGSGLSGGPGNNNNSGIGSGGGTLQNPGGDSKLWYANSTTASPHSQSPKTFNFDSNPTSTADSGSVVETLSYILPRVSPMIREFVQSVDDREWQTQLFSLLQSQSYNQCEVDLFELMCKVLDQNLFSQVDWARNTIFFKDLKVDDQMKLLQHSWSDMLVLDHLHQRIHNGLPDETTLHNGQKFDLLGLGLLGVPQLAEHFNELQNKLQELKFDVGDYICMKFLLLLNPAEVRGITNRKTILEGYENVQAALLDYTLTCYPSVSEKFSKLLSIIPEIHAMAARGEEHLYIKHCAGSAPTQTLLMEMLHAKRK